MLNRQGTTAGVTLASNPLRVCDSQVKGEGIALDQAHRLIIGKTQGHIQAISRGYNFGLAQHGGHIRIGVGDLVALVEQAGLQEGGVGIGVIGRGTHGLKIGLDATASD